MFAYTLLLDGACPLTMFQELKEIFDPLPVGCSLLVRSPSFYVFFQISSWYLFQAILDTCHSGTLLDLPHYHCNNVYVPWQSKGERRTMSLQNVNGSYPHQLPLSYADIRIVRHQATDFANSTFMPRSIESQFEGRWFPDEPLNELPQLDTKFGGRRSVDQGEFSPSRKSRESRRGRELERTTFESQPRYASPEATFVCDGWCEHSDVQYANIVSIGCSPWGRGDLMFPRRYLFRHARTCSAHGKAQKAR